MKDKTLTHIESKMLRGEIKPTFEQNQKEKVENNKNKN